MRILPFPNTIRLSDISDLELSMIPRLISWLAFLFVMPITAQELPPGVPKIILADGTVEVPMMFTSKAYQREVYQLLIREANAVARQLALPEKLPITETDVVACFISPFGFDYAHQRLGNITTSKYVYGAEQGNKFSELIIAHYDNTCLALCKRRKPLREFDRKTPYELATQWLAAVSMDVAALNRTCSAHVDASPFWNDLADLGDRPKGRSFVPIYVVWWEPRDGSHCPVSVELYLPKKLLIQLTVEDPAFIQRPPLVVTNLAAVFPGSYPTITNHPAVPEMVSPPGLK